MPNSGPSDSILNSGVIRTLRHLLFFGPAHIHGLPAGCFWEAAIEAELAMKVDAFILLTPLGYFYCFERGWYRELAKQQLKRAQLSMTGNSTQ
jgi:hypothetical protein